MLTKQTSNRTGYFRRIEPGRGHLVKQSLKEVMIALIDQRHLDAGLLSQPASGSEAAETGPDHQHLQGFFGLTGGLASPLTIGWGAIGLPPNTGSGGLGLGLVGMATSPSN